MAARVLTTMRKLLTYSELMHYSSYGDRLKYLQQIDKDYVSPRDMSNPLYVSGLWKDTRVIVMARDMFFDLAVVGQNINCRTVVHHMNPLTEEDIEACGPEVFDPEYLITTAETTHNIIHYKEPLPDLVTRKPGDTILW